MPASSWSGGTGPDGAMRATRSPSRSRRGPHAGGERFRGWRRHRAILPTRRGDRELHRAPARLFHRSPVAPTMFQTHVADKRHSRPGETADDEETVDRRSRGDSGNHGICRGHQQCRGGRERGRAGHPAPGARPGHGDAAADGLEHRRQHLGARRRLRRPRPLRPRDHRAVPLRRREHRDHRQPGVDDHDQAGPDVPERRAGRRRGVRPGLELRRLRPQRDGQQLLLRAHRGLRRDAGRDRRRGQRHRRAGGRHAVGPEGRRRPDARGHAQRPVRRLLHDARLHRLLPDRPGVPRRHRGVRRATDRQRPVPGRRVGAGREPDRQQVGRLHARRDPELRP